MKRIAGMVLAAGLATICAGAAFAQSTVTVTLKGVHSDKGRVVASLCDNPRAAFPGFCQAGSAAAPARQGDTVVVFNGVKPGTYALQVFHDENGDGRPQLPGEGMAFGNDALYPSFEAASIRVAGDTAITARMTYTAAEPAQGGRGAEPPPGVQRIDVRERGLYGELYMPARRNGRLPVIIVLGGSDGGLNSSGMAASFAAKGFAALALAYWKEQGLPQTLQNIPLEYFDTAVAWLKARPDIDPNGIGVIGWSRGSEAAMLLATRNRDIHAVALIAPSSIVWQGYDPTSMVPVDKPAWTVGGRAIPYVRQVARPYNPNEPMSMHFIGSLPVADRMPQAALPAEKVNGPILLLSGQDDRLWPSARMADRIVARLQGAQFPHTVEHLSYEGAGHAIFVGEPDSALGQQLTGANGAMGGTTAANRKAWEDNWPRTVAFFEKALRGRR